jgi:hypothetical protein
MLALATEVEDNDVGIMGLGPVADDVRVNNRTEPYKSILEVMVNASLISSESFSMWLNALDADEGNILFGGYDTAKFYEDRLNMLEMQTLCDYYTVALAGVMLDADSQQYDLQINDPFPVILDSGSTISSLPSSIFEPLADYLYATAYEGLFIVPCSLANRTGSLWFQFGSTDAPWVTVPLAELALPLPCDQNTTYEEDGSPACMFGLGPNNGDGDINILGDTFLRSAYVLFDLGNKQVGIANAK